MSDMTVRRRKFLQSAAALAAAPQALRGQQARRFRLGFIGMGRQGRSNMRAALKHEGFEVAAISEIYKPNLEQALETAPEGVKVYDDFRDLIADRSIDAICISTPDHWHAYMTIEACKAGKDVYVEKPISVTVHEGQLMVEAARKYGRVVQVGTQQRSGDHFRQARDAVREGLLGDITFVRTWNYGNQHPEGIGDPPDTVPPAGLDWDMWLGPAPEVPFNANRFGVHPERFSDFRWFWDYAGGMMTDWGIHLLDIVLWAMDEPGPRSVSAMGGKYAIQDNRETPDTILAAYEFPRFACVYENRICNAESMFDQGYGILFHGSEGTMLVDRRKWEITPERTRIDGGWRERMGRAEGASGNNQLESHWENFLYCMKTRENPVSDILEGHRSTAMSLLGNVALRSRQRFEWDPEAETTDNAEANSFLRREYRSPWKLEL